MTEWQKFKIKLANHPGKELASIFSICSFVVGLSKGFLFAIGIGLLGSIFWIPVLITAWTDRNKS
jgi:hypothetical protein